MRQVPRDDLDLGLMRREQPRPDVRQNGVGGRAFARLDVQRVNAVRAHGRDRLSHVEIREVELVDPYAEAGENRGPAPGGDRVVRRRRLRGRAPNDARPRLGTRRIRRESLERY